MSIANEFIGKTITGVIAARGPEGGPDRVWMMQFSDGTHVEFVSPRGEKRLQRAMGRRKPAIKQHPGAEQLSLNVA